MTASFYDQLRADTANSEREFRAIPLIATAISVGVDLPLYMRFLASAYHHVRHTCPLMALAFSRCDSDDAALREGLLHYIEEEKGHEEWILNDIEALGGDRAEVASSLAPFAVRMMVAYANFAIERISPYALLGMVHVLEGMSVALARAAAEAIMRSILPTVAQGGFSYLISHGTLDEDHIEQFAALLDRIDTPDRRNVVVQAARDFYQLYGDVFRSLAQSAEHALAA